MVLKWGQYNISVSCSQLYHENVLSVQEGLIIREALSGVHKLHSVHVLCKFPQFTTQYMFLNAINLFSDETFYTQSQIMVEKVPEFLAESLCLRQGMVNSAENSGTFSTII